MQRKTRILEILNSLPGETFIHEHAKAIIKYSDKVDLIWAFTQTSNIGKINGLEIKNLPTYSLPNHNQLSRISKLGLILKSFKLNPSKATKESALNLIRKLQIDHIHFQFASTAIQWYHLAEETEIPFSFSIRGTDIQIQPYLDQQYLNRLKLTSSKCNKVHAVCEDIKKEFLHLTDFPENQVKVIRTVINDKWKDIARMPIKGNWITVGRLHWRKGFADLILALKKVKDNGVDFQMSIIGEGPERQKLEYMIRDLNLDKNITLLGSLDQKQIIRLFEKAEIFILSSWMEGFPNVLGEALFAEIPIVTTNCNGIPELLENAENVFISPFGNPDDLSLQILKAIDSLSTRNNGEEKSINKNIKSILSAQNHANSFERFWLET